MIEQLHRVKASTRAAFVLLLAVVTVLLVTPPPDDVAAQPASENVWLTQRRILNMAHGGGLAEAPQGTLYAYKTAAARGANALEMDLHMTLDGHVVAIHDSTVDRTTNGTGCVVSKTLAELKALDAAYTFVPGEGPVSGRPAEDYTMRGIATGSVTPPAGFTASASASRPSGRTRNLRPDSSRPAFDAAPATTAGASGPAVTYPARCCSGTGACGGSSTGRRRTGWARRTAQGKSA